MTGTPPLLNRLATLSDLARVRLLRLLALHELSVGELAAAVQLPQSTVSRHLKLLHDGGWVIKRAAGTASLYRLVEDALDDDARELWRLTQTQLGDSHTLQDDDVRLAEVLAERREDSRTFFGRLGGEWDHVRKELFGAAFTSEAFLAFMPSHWVVADLGCGTGNGAAVLAPYVRKVIGIDREPAMIEAAQRRTADLNNVEFREGELTSLPLEDGEVDGAVVLLVLHHLEEPLDALRDIHRVLAPQGVLLVVDMVPHDREAYRHTMRVQQLGFDESTVRGWASDAGFDDARYSRLRPAIGAKGPGLFVATMRKS